MSNTALSNHAHSIFTKLKNLAKEKGYFLNQLLIRYANERFLYRLSISEFAKQFVLKGGNLFIIWQNGWSYRPTIDSDLLCFGKTDEQHLAFVFTQLCNADGDESDGMKYDASSITVSQIRDDTEYGGTRIGLNAFLGNARIHLQFDIGIGDAITPAAEIADFPVLLNGAIPKLRIYPKETAIAEKIEAMISKGFENSRMKDFYDVWLLSELFSFDYNVIKEAVFNTFSRRGTAIPLDLPICFSDEFINATMKQTQWSAFIKKNKLQINPGNFCNAVLRIKDFMEPVLFSDKKISERWLAGKGWE